jgi:hypothetical protein
VTRRTAMLLAAGAALPTRAPGQAPNEDPLLRAMRDELARSRSLSVPGLEAPYFIQYAIEQGGTFAISASLGGLVSRRKDTFRVPEIQVRVGSYQFDNSNYIGSGAAYGSRYDLGRFPLEDDYGALRRYLWLATDSAYKSAVEAISRKRAALKSLSVSERIDDFARAAPLKHLGPTRRFVLDEDAWTARVREISGIFARYPGVKASSVEMECGQGAYYIVNSEGTEVREPGGVTYLRVRAAAQSSDGMMVRDAVTWQALDPAHMPLDAELRRGAAALAENVLALAKAPRGEDYSGPILFEGQAGPQIFAEVLGKNLTPVRRPVMEPGRPGSLMTSELEGRQGARIMPEGFDVVDDPSQVEWRGRPLFGSYRVDREGVPAVPLKLVEKGVLKSFLLTRQPMRGMSGSNGRARMPGSFGAQTAGFGNLFVSAAEAVPPLELKRQLLDMIRSRNKPYGIVVRKMDFPSSASLEEARRLLVGGQSSGARPISMPLLTFRVYPDGREELVRGVRLRGLNARSLKDIVAAGNDPTVFDFLDNPAPFALMGAVGFVAETCVVAPSILIDDLELHPLQDELPKLPVAPPPEMGR